MSKIKCPICGKEYEDLGKLAGCITAHDKDMKCKEQEEKQKRIEALRKQNDALYDQLTKNCEVLRKLGCDARTTYSVGNLIRTPFATKPNFVNSQSLEDEINRILQSPKEKETLKKNIVSDWTDIFGMDEEETGKLIKELSDTLGAILGGKE